METLVATVAEVVPIPPPHRRHTRSGVKLILEERASDKSRAWPWADLLLRVFSQDGFACPRCNRRMTLRAIVIGAPATTEVLDGIDRAVDRSRVASNV